MNGRIFAIGDIHGCLSHLNRMLETIPFDPWRDRIVFMGDYIDRGPRSFGVVQRVIDLKNEYPETVCLLGNHEWMFLEYLSGVNTFNFLYNGGYQTLDSYEKKGRGGEGTSLLPSSHESFFKSLSLYWETEEFIFVHAGLRPHASLKDQDPQDLIWIREDFYHSSWDFGKTVIFGHTPFGKPFLAPGKIGIDTGAVYGNKLTCVSLPDKTFFQV